MHAWTWKRCDRTDTAWEVVCVRCEEINMSGAIWRNKLKSLKLTLLAASV